MSDSKAGCSVCGWNSSFPKEGLRLRNIFSSESPSQGHSSWPDPMSSLPTWFCVNFRTDLVMQEYFFKFWLLFWIIPHVDVFSMCFHGGEVSPMPSYSTILIFSELKATLLLKTLQWLSISLNFFAFFKHVKCILVSLSILLPLYFLFALLKCSSNILTVSYVLLAILSSAYVKSNSLVIYFVFYFSII